MHQENQEPCPSLPSPPPIFPLVREGRFVSSRVFPFLFISLSPLHASPLAPEQETRKLIRPISQQKESKEKEYTNR